MALIDAGTLCKTDAAAIAAGKNTAEIPNMTASSQPPYHLPESPPFVSPGAWCPKATAQVGQRRGAINIVAHCRGPHNRSRVPSITVTREEIGTGPRASIRAFRRQPKVYGPGALRRHGVCKHENGAFSEGGYAQRTINCWARAKGKIVIKIRVWVKASTRCSMRLAISTPIAEKLEERQLFQHRPTGCTQQRVSLREGEKPDGAQLWNKQFRGVSLKGHYKNDIFLHPSKINLSFTHHYNQQWIGWSDNCNDYSAHVRIDQDLLRLGLRGSTTMLCPPGGALTLSYSPIRASVCRKVGTKRQGS